MAHNGTLFGGASPAGWSPSVIRNTIKALEKLSKKAEHPGHGTPRGFVRARYRKAAHVRDPRRLGLAPVRLKVLKAVCESGTSGCLARDIRRKARLSHGSVQQTLNWLRLKGFVTAQEDWRGEKG